MIIPTIYENEIYGVSYWYIRLGRPLVDLVLHPWKISLARMAIASILVAVINDQRVLVHEFVINLFKDAIIYNKLQGEETHGLN